MKTIPPVLVSLVLTAPWVAGPAWGLEGYPSRPVRLLTQGATPAPTSPEEFDAFIRSEVKRFAKILIAAGARIN